jgi:conjugal transfer/entry exclusion protein
MENKVKRYLCSGYDGVMIPFGVGDWVAYDDYCKLKDDFDKNNSKWYDITVKSSAQSEKSIVSHISDIEQLKRMYDGAAEALKDSISNQSKLHSENESLKAKVKTMALDSIQDINQIVGLQEDNRLLKANVERLTKAVIHSPAAQLKLKELEGKTTFEEINGKDGKPNE